ncbi:MAG: transposase [Verrucomicrobia bacterium]|nr:transposase [Verrucomicrobiota bacterium]MBU1910732.1 transposase [Verrucomicrobiota bacterium]
MSRLENASMSQAVQGHFPGRPPRLPAVFHSLGPPLYFVTVTTWRRQAILASPTAQQAFMNYAQANAEQGRAIGRFVLMPDHIHFFVRLVPNSRLTDFVRLLKQAMTNVLRQTENCERVWQPGFFDHVLRSDESCAEKWIYVRANPVRAGLVKRSEDWPYQGEIVRIDRA